MTDKDNFKDIPETPEWEKAFSEYAKDQAPDLMPRILARINQSEEPVTRTVEAAPEEPVTEVPETKQKRKMLSRLLSSRTQKWILSISGAAAAVLLVGVLIILGTRTPKHDNRATNDELKSSSLTPNALLTVAGRPEWMAEDTPYSDAKDEIPKDEVNDVKGKQYEPESDTSSVTPAEKRDQQDNVMFRYVLDSDASLSLSSKSDAEPEYHLLQDITLGDAISIESGKAYIILHEGVETGLVLKSDDFLSPGEEISTLTVSVVGVVMGNDRKYLLVCIPESAP